MGQVVQIKETPEFITTRELAELTGRTHGNLLRMVRGMVKRRELALGESFYENVPGGTKFVEFHLKPEHLAKMSNRLGAEDDQKWRKHFHTGAARIVSEATTRAATPVPGRVAEVAKTLIPDVHPLTMSSLEIAQLTGKEHFHVVRDIRAMIDEIPDDPNLDDVKIFKDGRGYTSEIHLSRDLTQTLITGYSVPLRLAVIRRLNELEAQVVKPAFAVPTTLVGALRLAAELEEQRSALAHAVEVQVQQIAQNAPKVEFYDDVADNGELTGVQAVAKTLNTGQKRLFNYLRKHKILIGGSGDDKNMPFQKHIDSGRLAVKWNNYTVPETGETKVRPRPLFTGKGLIWIREFIEENGREGL